MDGNEQFCLKEAGGSGTRDSRPPPHHDLALGQPDDQDTSRTTGQPFLADAKKVNERISRALMSDEVKTDESHPPSDDEPRQAGAHQRAGRQGQATLEKTNHAMGWLATKTRMTSSPKKTQGILTNYRCCAKTCKPTRKPTMKR